MMAFNEKILKALSSAASYLEGSMKAFKKNDKDSFSHGIWHLAAELEYALFFFSLTLKEEDYDNSDWKSNPEAAKMEADEMLEKIMELLDKAKANLISGRLSEAYKNAYEARHYAFIIQGGKARKKREVSKRK